MVNGRWMRTVPACVLSAALLAACQPTPEDPIVAGKNNGNMEQIIASTPVPQDTLAPEASPTPAPTPMHCTDSFAGAEETVTIHVDADVVVPDVNVPVVKVTPHFIGMDQIREMADVLFQGNTAYEPHVGMSRGELEAEILHLQQIISDNDAMLEYYGGDQDTVDEVKAMYERRIAEYRQQYKNAPETIDIRETDWTFRPKAYYKDMAVYGDNLQGDDKQSVYLQKEYYESETLQLSATVEGFHAFIEVMNSDTDYRISHDIRFCMGSDLSGSNTPIWNDSDTRPMSMTRAEAVAMVSGALSRMGIDNMALYQCNAYGKTEKVDPPSGLSEEEAALYAASGEGADPPRDNADEAGEDVYGYQMTFVPSYEGVATADMDSYNFSTGGNDYGPMYPYEQLRVTVINGMITEFYWSDPMDAAEVENPNVATLSLEDALAAFKQQMQVEYTLVKQSHYTPENEDYNQYLANIESSDIYITDIRMSLMRVRVQNQPGEYRMIPAWIFTGFELLSYKSGEKEPMPVGNQLDSALHIYTVINAIDGTIIDVYQGY